MLTIHNIEYQGRYNDTLGDLFGLDSGWAKDGTLLMDGDVNLLKGAIFCADAVTAVSPTYANELKMAYFAHRLEGIANAAISSPACSMVLT
ncbi:MAG: glycogen/starch synthase [Dysosmobacter sp.]